MDCLCGNEMEFIKRTFYENEYPEAIYKCDKCGMRACDQEGYGVDYYREYKGD